MAIRILPLIVLVLVVITPFYLLSTQIGGFFSWYINPAKGLYYYPILSKPLSGEIKLDGLKGKVIVVVDKNGVPHIYGEYEEDVFMVLGWLHARDRMWQIDFLRRVGYGNLSTLVGEKALNLDKFMRTLGYHITIQESFNLLVDMAERGDKWAQRALAALYAYSRGVNAWIKWAVENEALPLEYNLLKASPTLWKPKDSIAVSMVIIHGLGFSNADMLLAKLSKSNSAILKLLIDAGNWSAKKNSILKGNEWSIQMRTEFTNYTFLPPVKIANHRDVVVLNTTIKLESVIDLATRAIHETSMWSILRSGFSNNWVISGKLTKYGYPILANDPHLELTVPPIWYEAHLVANNTGLNIYGAGFPGIPFIIIGRNEHVAFGYTNSMIDVVDFYYYSWVSNDTYIYLGENYRLEKRTEIFTVSDLQGSYKEVKHNIYYTIHGPLISLNPPIAVKTTTTIPAPLVVWAYRVMYAKNVYDILYAQQYFYAPIQNAVAADIEGNILYSPTGLIPVRNRLPRLEIAGPQGSYTIVNTGFLPFNGSNAEGEWIGFLSFAEIPRVINPQRGYIVTANNYILPTSELVEGKQLLQLLVCDRYRAQRIEELIESIIESRQTIDEDDVKLIQIDTKSLAIKELLSTVIRETPIFKKELEKYLTNWNYSMDPDDYRPSLFFTFIKNLHRSLWLDVFNNANTTENYGCEGVRVEVTEFLFRADENYRKWFLANVFNKTLADLVNRAINSTYEELYKLYKTTSLEEMKWGNKHFYDIRHVFGEVLKWLNYEKLPAPGDPYTVNPSPETSLGRGVKHGPSLRFIAIMIPGRTNGGYFQIPGGNSGYPFSIFFDNQYYAWARGGYHEIRLDRNPQDLEDIAFSIALFVPRG